MACSQGRRSSSVNGCPALILATLAAGWNLSPSSKLQRSRSASSFAIVLLPEPDTPITISAQGFLPTSSLTKILRQRGLIPQPSRFAKGTSAVRRQVLAIEHARQDSSLVGTRHLEQHFTAGGKRRHR